MRVALQISGQQRYSDYFADLLNSLRVFDELDLFFHHWAGPRDADGIRALVQYGQVREIRIDKQIEFAINPDWQRLESSVPIFNIRSAAYGIQAVNTLRLEYERQTGTRYDLVIRARSDIRPMRLPKNAGWYRVIRPMVVCVGGRGTLDADAIQDQFAIGQPATMTRYAQLFEAFEPFHASGRSFHPEQLLRWHLVREGVRIVESTLFDVELDRRGGFFGHERDIY